MPPRSSLRSRRGPPSLVITLRPLDHAGSRFLRYRLDGPAITIGRSPANRVSLEAPTLSRVHASLEWRGPELRELWLSDLDSRNGTWFLTHGAARVRPCEPLRLLPGEDSFAVGPFWVAVDRWQLDRHGELPSVDRVRLGAEAFLADVAKEDADPHASGVHVAGESAPASARRKRVGAPAR